MENKGREYIEVLFENGDIYKGEVESDKFNGYGLFHRKDKFTYAGEFKNSTFHGIGRYWEPENIMIYQGEFNSGKKHGVGRLEWYVNNISYGPLVPQASEIDNNSFKSYIRDKIIAEIKKDIDNEISKEITKISQSFSCMEHDLIKENIQEFEWSQDLIDQFKKERTRSTFSKRYVGQFLNDFKHGLGRMDYTNSDIYEGCFKVDKRQGYGKYIYLSTGHSTLAYLGNFNEDTMHGYGKLLYKNSDYYIGEFRSNRMHDENGTIHYKNGDKYEGSVAMDKKHSKRAQYFFWNGDVYSGGFRGDK